MNDVKQMEGNIDYHHFQQQQATKRERLDIVDNYSKEKRSVLVLVNPHSGRGKSVSIYKKRIAPFLNSHNVDHDVFISDSDTRAGDYLHKKSLLELINLRSIIVVSGDGLFHEVVNALMSRDDWEQAITVPIGLVPTGSGNGLAYTLLRQNHPDLQDKDEAIRICCEQIIQDETCQTDMVKLTYGRGCTVWSFLSIGWGLLADIDIDSEWLRRFGELRFTVYGLLRSITSVSYSGRLSFKVAPPSAQPDDDSGSKTSKLGSQLIQLAEESNTTFNMAPHKFGELAHNAGGGGDSRLQENYDDWIHIEDRFACLYAVYQSHISRETHFAPKSTLTDQLIYLTYVRGKLSPCKVVEFLLAIQDGSHEKLPYVIVVPVTKFKFQPLELSKVVVDGEVIPWNLSDGPLTAEVAPKMVKLLWKGLDDQ